MSIIGVIVTPSTRANKLLTAHILLSTGRAKRVSFGDKNGDQFFRHNDTAKRAAYVARHKKAENWTSAGALTAGFWSRWLLWNKPTLEASADWITRRFGFNIIGPWQKN
jgi:hypothetical protein